MVMPVAVTGASAVHDTDLLDVKSQVVIFRGAEVENGICFEGVECDASEEDLLELARLLKTDTRCYIGADCVEGDSQSEDFVNYTIGKTIHGQEGTKDGTAGSANNAMSKLICRADITPHIIDRPARQHGTRAQSSISASSLKLRKGVIQMATTFLDLPDELILRIAELLFAFDRGNLRLLAKRVDRLISPGLFETLRFTASSPEKYTSLSEDVELGKELVFRRCTKKIDIDIYDIDPFHRHIPWLRLLSSLVPTLANLQSLEWSHWPRKQPVPPLILDVFNSFASVPSLRELTISVVPFTPFPEFTLKSFSNLSSFTLNWGSGADVSQDMISDIADLLGRCPDLEQFTFSIPRPYHPSQVPAVTHLFAGLPPTACLKLRQLDLTGLHVSADDFRVHLRHLSTLKVLRLMFNRHADAPKQNDQICRILLENSIYLDELTIDTTHPAGVLEYLSSYSGLERLTFCSRYPGADTPEGVHHFFFSILPLHSATLRELRLGWGVETLWTKGITPEDLAQLEKCQRLTSLSCSVTITIGSVERTDRLLGAWLESALKLPWLRRLIFFPTCRGHPPLHDGRFYYDQHTMHDYNLAVQIDKFGMERIEKLKARRVVPFRVIVASPTLGR